MNVFGIAVFATWGSSSTGKPFQLSFQNGSIKTNMSSIFILNLNKYLQKEIWAESLNKTNKTPSSYFMRIIIS